MTNEDDRREAQRSGFRVPWWAYVLVVLSAYGIATWFMWEEIPEKKTLRGVLVDLELHPAESPRFSALRDVLTRRLAAEEPILPRVDVSVACVHFTEFKREFIVSRQIDFVVLSPQGTPWHRYSGAIAPQLESAKQLLKELVLSHDMPVLGICGGHQFMTLAFGGTVGFIDPRLNASAPDRYPRDAISEQGLTTLETVQDDPIFAGVAEHPGKFSAIESHYEEVKQVPSPFVNLARSELSEAQLIRIPDKPVYGMAFHPERGWDSTNGSDQLSTSGRRILANFLLMVSRHKGRVHSGSGRSASVSR